MNFDQTFNRLHTYCTQWDYIEDRFGEKDLLPFSISDTDFSVPKEVLEILQKRIQHPIFGYTRWNHDDFKLAISNHYKKRFDMTFDASTIAYSPSVMYTIAKLLHMLSDTNDGVVCFDPMYDAFISVVTCNQRTLLTSKISIENNYAIDFHDFEENIKQAKILLLCSPHNPTGKVFSKEELEHIVSICKKYNVWIISDEIHSDVVLYGNTHTPILAFTNMYANIVLVSSASKTFNTPSLGGSYVIFLTKDMFDQFLEITRKQDFVNSPSVLGMLATMSAYDACDYYIDELVDYIEENMNTLEEFLQSNYPSINFSKPQATYLAWIDVSNIGYTMDELQEALVRVGKVGIMRGDVYGENGKGYLRMNIGCPKEKLLEGLKRFDKAMKYLENT